MKNGSTFLVNGVFRLMPSSWGIDSHETALRHPEKYSASRFGRLPERFNNCQSSLVLIWATGILLPKYQEGERLVTTTESVSSATVSQNRCRQDRFVFFPLALLLSKHLCFHSRGKHFYASWSFESWDPHGSLEHFACLSSFFLNLLIKDFNCLWAVHNCPLCTFYG